MVSKSGIFVPRIPDQNLKASNLATRTPDLITQMYKNYSYLNASIGSSFEAFNAG